MIIRVTSVGPAEAMETAEKLLPCPCHVTALSVLPHLVQLSSVHARIQYVLPHTNQVRRKQPEYQVTMREARTELERASSSQQSLPTSSNNIDS